MSRESRGRRSLSLLLTASGGGAQRAFAGLLNLFIVAVASRSYGARAAGVLGIATTLALVGATLADFGTTPMSLREFARRAPSRAELWSLLKGKLVLSAVVAAVLGGGSLLGGGDVAAATLICVTTLPVIAATTTITSWLIVESRGLPLVAGASVGFVAGAGVALVLATQHAPIPVIALALPVARVTELLVVYRMTSYAAARGEPRDFSARALLRFWPLAAQGVLQILYQRSTILIAGWVLGTTAAGVVTQGASLAAALVLLPSVLATAAFPSVVVAARREPAAALSAMKRFAALALATMAPFALALIAWPDGILTLLYGSSDSSLNAFMRWAALSLLLAGPNSLIFYLFMSVDRERLLVAVSVPIAFTSAALVFVGAHLDGVPGVGWSLFASELLTTVCFAIAWRWARRPKRVAS